jgi:prepilin-type N-terminal cleavage/methylation domain-containing protein
MTKTAGFTLIELMIVVAIIATLAAMAVPTFIIYRDRSRVTQVVGSSEVFGPLSLPMRQTAQGMRFL